MSPPILKLEQITTAFGENYVHRGISFELKRGTITALIGGSGCGKSTLLRVILRLLQPQKGSVELFGTNVWESDEEALLAVRRRYGV